MVKYPNNNLFLHGDTDRQLKIAFRGGTITNKEMHQGSFELSESICSERSLVFGTSEASVLKFKIHNVLTSLIGETLTVYEVLNGNTAEPFYYGTYKVHSDKPTADRKYREIVAYDAMYDILNADVANWYNALSFPCTLGYFRNKFLAHFGLEYVETDLVNDGIYISKTIDVAELSGKTVINAICQLNGCFGHINRQGKFEFILLEQHEEGLYPSETLYPSEELFPKDPISDERFDKSRYITCKYEDFETQSITGVQIRKEEDDIGAVVGTSQNLYIIQDNFLVYGKSANDLKVIAENIFSVISKITYVPLSMLKTSGKPYLEVGDRVLIATSERAVETYILERTISGVKGQKDEFIARGTETYGKELNGIAKQFTQLQGRYNKLTRTVDETRSEIGNLENQTETRFVQTDQKIEAEARRANAAEASLRVTADQISANVNAVSSSLYNNYYTMMETDSKISASANNILLSVSRTYYPISEANNDYYNLQSQIDINAGNISLKVSAGEVVSAINVSSETIELRGNRLIVESTNFSLKANGDCNIKGHVEATSGSIGGFSITPSESGGWLEHGDTILSEHTCYFGAVYTDDINGYTPVTSGNIDTYIPSTSNFVTDSELSTVLGAFVSQTSLESTLQSYPTYSALNNVLNQKGYLTSSDLYGYATEYWVGNQLSDYLTTEAFNDWKSETDLEFRVNELEQRCGAIEDRLDALEATL